ncbi:MAG: pilus assembly protein N-terminal domain-containing protein [Pseudomonadota bacterium]
MSAPLVATPASANDLYVKYDQSQLIRLPRPVAEVIIGNATIADVAVKSGDLLVITGKSFGITNIIALDASRNVIQDQRVIVQRDELATVNVQLGNSRRSYNCSPQCNPSITVGDDREYLSQVAGDTLKKIKMSEDIRSQGGQAR